MCVRMQLAKECCNGSVIVFLPVCTVSHLVKVGESLKLLKNVPLSSGRFVGANDWLRSPALPEPLYVSELTRTF